MKETFKKVYENDGIGKLWLVGIFLLFFITRFWKLYSLPSGLHVDEAGMAYDAWCLATYGVDRYLKSWPVYLTNFGGGQSSLYAFIVAILFKVFGFSKMVIRIPAIFFSLLTLIFGMKIVKKLFPDNIKFAYIYGSIVVIAPYFIMASRFGLDCNLMLGMTTVFMYMFISAVETDRVFYYCMAGITGGLALYTYVLSYLVLPLFLLLGVLYTLRLKKFRFLKWIFMSIPMGLLALPLIMVQIVNMFDLPEMQWGIFTITKLAFYRGGELGLPNWTNFATTLISVFQGDEWVYNSIPGRPVLYGITNVLFAIGFWQMGHIIIEKCIQKEHELYTYIFLWYVSMIIMGAMTVTNVNKMNAIYAAHLMIALYGLKTLLDSRGYLKIIFGSVVTACYLIGFFNFGTFYYSGEYAASYEPIDWFNDTVSEANAYILENEKIRNKPTQMGQRDIYYAVSALPSPYDYQNGENTAGIICGGLGLIEDTYNYIVEDYWVEYSEELRVAGFTEKKYNGYSLFYKE